MRYSLRTLLVATTALVVWLGWQAERMHRQREAVADIKSVPGAVEYRDVLDWPAVSERLSQWLGRDAIANVEAVYLGGTTVSDGDLACLRSLPGLRTLVLTSTPVSDAGLLYLYGMRNLETIDLRFTAVTDSGITQLRRALPRARIVSKSDID